MKITNVQNPKYLFADNNKILCEIQIDSKTTWQEYLASDDDVEVHGQELYADLIAGKYGTIALYVEPIATAQENKDKATLLLSQTDWVNQPDVYDTTINPHLLNRNDFIAYRAQLRTIAVNPVDGNLNWTTIPMSQWSNI
jgi:hypothetical protein